MDSTILRLVPLAGRKPRIAVNRSHGGEWLCVGLCKKGVHVVFGAGKTPTLAFQAWDQESDRV